VSQPAREVEQTSVHQDLATPAPTAEPPILERIASTDTMLALQATAGNRAVTTMLQRQPKTLDKTPPKADPVEDTWQALLAFSARATPELARVGRKVEDYLSRYDAAFAKFSGRLDKADKEAAAERKWADAMAGMIIGIGVGFASGGLYAAATVVGKLVHETVDASAGFGIQQALGSPPAEVDFKPPPELNNDKVARGQLQQLVRAWQALSIVQASTLALSNRRDTARAGKGDSKLVSDFEHVRGALAQTEQALTVFLTTVDTPLLNRGEFRLQQDMWINWMSRSRANAREMIRGGSINERGNDLRIFGRLTEPYGELDQGSGEGLQQLAKAEQERMGMIGQVGVVIVPPRTRSGRGRARPGVVRTRDDAYTAAGRAAPQQGLGVYAKLSYQQHMFLRPGEVVMISEIEPTGVVVERLGPELSVGIGERQTAMQMLGIKENEYEPEAGEVLFPYVSNALGVLRDEPLKLSESEDGVLVSHADGTKLVLFAPLTPGDWRAGATRRDRVGARKVVLINWNRQIEARAAREPGIVVLLQSDAYALADEIREVLPKPAKPAGAR
jgi:hypothetical protein